MTQSRYSVLVSLCLLLLLTAGFFEASRVVFNKLHSSVAAAIATATVVVLPPTPTRPPATATPKGGGHAHPNAAPKDTPTDNTAQVVVATTLNVAAGSSTIPSNSPQVYCMISLPNVAPSAPIRIQFQKLPTAEDYFHHDGAADSYNTPLKFAYIYGPLDPGQWRCQVLVSGQLAGSAPFTVK